MMAPLIERNASPDTFCLFYVNKFYSRAFCLKLSAAAAPPARTARRPTERIPR
jgi:hypothetical protein